MGHQVGLLVTLAVAPDARVLELGAGLKLGDALRQFRVARNNTVWDDGTSSAETIVWDDYAKLSSPGSVSEDKITFSAGETQTFTLADFTLDPTAYGTLGVKATSVNGGGTIKWADLTPEVGQAEPTRCS